MEVEVIGGVHTIFHTSKEHTRQLLANLLFRFYCENRIKQIQKEKEKEQEVKKDDETNCD